MPSTPSASAPARPDAVQLDAGALARLHELDPDGRHCVVDRVFRAFESSLVHMLGELGAQRAGGDAEVVSSLAHKLKSSAASVGALALAQACAEVEQRLRTGEPGSLGGDIERLLHAGEAALVAVKAMLRQ
ncbi:MAG: Hpt domain-containing protein [Rubrivivax sp.]|nr:Hpt domain-containing protein [Rubrivivax sp.]